jgi:hypothetical protein
MIELLADSPDETSRQALVHGLGAFASADYDEQTERVLRDLAQHDPAPNVRVAARARLEVRSIISPTTAAQLDTGTEFGALHDNPRLPDIRDGGTAALAEHLQHGGPGLRFALELLRVHPDLRRLLDDDVDAPVRAAFQDLVERTLAGRTGVETVSALIDILGYAFVARALAALVQPQPDDLTPLVSGLATGCPMRGEVFAALATYGGRRTGQLAQATLSSYQLDPLAKADVLLHRLESMAAPDPGAVRLWSDVLRELIEEQLDRTQLEPLQPRIIAVTQHVLGLLPDGTEQLGGTQPASGTETRSGTENEVGTPE